MMKKEGYILLILIFCLNINVLSQNKLKYTFHGNVKKENSPISECIIKVYYKQKLFSYTKSASNGKFAIDLDLKKVYQIEFIKSGFLTTQISLSTIIKKRAKLTNNSLTPLIVNLISLRDIQNFNENFKISSNYIINKKDGSLKAVNTDYASIAYNEAIYESERMLAEAKDIMQGSQYKADTIIQTAILRKEKINIEAEELLVKIDSLKKAMNEKIFNANYKPEESDELSDENKIIVEENNKELNTTLNKNSLTLRDSLTIFEKIANSKEIILNETKNRLLEAEKQKDSTTIFTLRKKIKKLEPEIALIKDQAALFKAQVDLKEKEIEKKNIQFYAIIGVSLLLLGISGVLYMYYRNKKRAGLILIEKNALLNKQKEEIEMQAGNLLNANKLILQKNKKLTEQRDRIDHQNKEITSSVKYASTIQRAILPEKEELSRLFNIFTLYKPKDIVSGDFYWSSTINKTKEYKFIAVVDCTGHGIPGAFMSMIGISLLNEIVYERKIIDPAEILTTLDVEIRTALKQEKTRNTDGMDVCLCRMETHKNNKTKITFSGAKRPLFYYECKKDNFARLRGDRKTIGGLYKKQSEFSNSEIILSENDYIYLTSDGFIDQNNPKRESYNTNRFMEFLQKISRKSLEEQEFLLNTELENFQNGIEQRDDITVLGIKI